MASAIINRHFRIIIALGLQLAFLWLFSGSSLGDAPAYYGVFKEAPPASIQPQGWLKEMLQRQVMGLGLNHDVSGYPFNTCLWAGHIPRDVNPKSKAWWPYEQAGYLVDGLERLGVSTGDRAITAEASSNVDYILAHPMADGSLGPDDIGPNNWPHAVVFRAMMEAYAVSNNQTIPEAMRKHYLARPTGFGEGRDACNIEEMLWTYAHTGDPRLLALALHTYDVFNAKQPKTSLSALAGDQQILEHGVTFNETAKLPALLYLYTGNQALLDATANAYRKIDRDHMLADGLHSAEERLAGKSPWRYHETCNVSDYTWSVGYLLMASGDAAWADHIEKTIFNAGLGSITKDFKSHQYFSAPNQVVAGPGICPRYDPDRQAYRPGHDVECCSGNVHRFLPNFALRQWMVTPAGGIVAALYSPSKFTTRIGGNDVTIDEQTDYPFSDVIRFQVHASAPTGFTMLVRIPGWTHNPQLNVNDTTWPATAPGTFTKIDRMFTDGDVITLHLPMQIQIRPWEHGTVSIERGPLVYTLEIAENANEIYGTKTSANFPAWDKQPASPWNYAIDLGHPIEVKMRQNAGYVWDTGHSPITLVASGRQVTNWVLPANHHNPEFVSDPKISDRLDPVTFVPYGSTCLRLTVLPRIGG